MIKKTVTYTDYFGEERTEDFYFNLSKAEVVEWEVSEKGGLSKWIEKVLMERDPQQLIALFKDLTIRSYGERTADGRFVKTQEVKDKLIYSEAYSEIFMELAVDDVAAAEFVNGIMPDLTPEQEAELKAKMKERADNLEKTAIDPKDRLPVPKKTTKKN